VVLAKTGENSRLDDFGPPTAIVAGRREAFLLEPMMSSSYSLESLEYWVCSCVLCVLVALPGASIRT